MFPLLMLCAHSYRCSCERIRSGEVSANIEDVGAWLYFTGRAVNTTSEETSLSVRFAYQGDQVILVHTCFCLRQTGETYLLHLQHVV